MVVMMGKSGRFPGGYFDNGVENKDEGYDNSGRIHEEVVFASKDSSVPVMKYFNLGSLKQESFGVPVRSLHLSSMLASEKEELVRRLRKELERTRKLLKEAEFRRAATLTSPDSTLNFCKRKSQHGVESIQKLSGLSCGTGMNLNRRNEMSQGAPGRSDSVKGFAGQSTGNAILMKKCDNLLRSLMSHQYGWIFKSPVDAVKLRLPDYFTIIKHPMDLGTVKKKIASGAYSGPVDFVADVRLTFSNAITYNPPGHEVHNMAATLSKLFETRWKDIEKKLCQTSAQRLCENSDSFYEFRITKATSQERERKVTSFQPSPKPKPKPKPEHIFEQIMTREQKMKLGEELQSMIVDMPSHIFYFLREHSSDWKENAEDEIEIDIDNLSNSTLFKLRKLVDDYLLVKENTLKKVEPCEIEPPNESGQRNSSMQPFKGSNPVDEDVDIGSNDHPDSSCHLVEVKKSPGHDCRRSISSGSSSEAVRAEQKLSTVESEGHFADSKSESTERQMSPSKLYRAAVLKKRFADTILRAQEKALIKGESGDPEKLRREKEELEILHRKEKARLLAGAKAAEVARRRAEADAATAAKQKREMEREAARQALLKMEKTAEIIENPRFLEDLEMLSAAPTEHFPCLLAETSPEHVEDGDGLSSFRFEGNNPLEKLGLYMREDEEEEDGESVNDPSIVNANDDDDLEEGEIN